LAAAVAPKAPEHWRTPGRFAAFEHLFAAELVSFHEVCKKTEHFAAVSVESSMKRLLWLFLALLSVVPAFGSGLIIVHEPDFWIYPPPHHPPHHPPPRIRPPRPAPVPTYPIELSHTKIEGKIKDQIATTHVDQEFYNPNSRQLEGTFLFPVPKGAQIDKFTMEINGKQVEAELLAADKARGIYEDIVRKLKDPALLEFAGRDLFKVRIFPIEPHSRKRITLSYSQLLKSDSGLVSYVVPFNTEKFCAKPVKDVSLKIELETKQPLKSVYSPSHKVEVKRKEGNRATIGFESNDVRPDTDFQLLYDTDKSDIGLQLLTFKESGEEGYFVLLASPGSEVRGMKVMAKDVVFVLDTSGSMAGAKLEQAKKALLFCVENLNKVDRFDVLRFATEVEPLFDKLTDAESDSVSRAKKWIEELKPIGGTAINDALAKALANRPEKSDRPYVVVFLTDGRPTVGVTDEGQIRSNVTKKNEDNTRIFCFGIGTDVNTHLLDSIAEDTRAFSQYVLPEEDIEVKVSSFFTKIKEPVLASPKLVFPDSVRVTKVYPATLPDVFKGEQLVVAGRYSGKSSGAIRLQGTVNGETKSYSYDGEFEEKSSDHEFIPRLWATRRVGYLLDEIRLRGESKELKDEVSELARKYNIVTPYTAYLIMEDERQRGVAANYQTFEFRESEVARRELRAAYDGLNTERSGDRAVGDARHLYRLKAAETPAIIQQSNEDLVRGYAATAAPTSPATGLPAQSFGGVTGGTVGEIAQLSRAPVAEAGKPARAQMQQRFVAGRAFTLKTNAWVDSEIQKKQSAKRVRVQFDSPEYFELVSKNPKAQSCFALGRNVQFVLGDTIYEIYE
jgi:Ca-activated chloride channel homolog